MTETPSNPMPNARPDASATSDTHPTPPALTAAQMADRQCEHCRRPESEHWVLNHANGGVVSGDVLVCPTSTFLLRQRKRGGWAAVMDDRRPK